MPKAKTEKKAPNVVKVDIAKSCGKVTSVSDALDCASLNFVPEVSELMSPSFGVFAEDHRMILRADTNDVLGVVGKGYHPTPNSTAFAFMDNIVQQNGFSYTEAVSKNNGAVSVLTAQSDHPDEINVGDTICKQIKLINGFDGKHSLSCEMSSIRLVCLNGLTTNDRASMIRFKHTIKLENRMAVALKVFDQSAKFHDQFIATAKLLAQKAVDKTMVEKFLNGLYGDAVQNQKKKDKIEELFQSGKGNNGNTLWDIYNGATEFYNHFDSSDEKRLDSLMFGTGAKKNALAWDLATSML